VVGIGPFVVGPVVELKIGRAAYAQLALDAAEFRSAAWAQARGLYAGCFETIAELDAAVQTQAAKLASYNPEALAAMKQVIWEGTEHWDSLLSERAAISGRLVLSDFTRQAIAQFKGAGK
jgi:methylglutaconyl-CoA hydratase